MMNDETQNHIGYYQNTETAETKEITPTIRRIRRMDAKTQRCRRDTKGQTKSRTGSIAANGFLKCSFLPKMTEQKCTQEVRKSEKKERDFYRSLSQLAGHYGMQPMQTKQYGYPYNVALAFQDAEQQLKDEVMNFEALLLIADDEKTCIASRERYNTGDTLYYIPVIPLYRLSKIRGKQQAYRLLLSVCSYLYHVADIPYYRQENAYLYWMYEMISECVLECDITEYSQAYAKEIEQAKQIGNLMEKEIYNHYNMSRFKNRLEQFKSKSSFDLDCFKLASGVFELYKKFPNQTIFRNAKPDMEKEDDHWDDILSMDKYVSFYADGKGLLFESLFDAVNTEFREYGAVEEPTICKRFDGSDITSTNLEFENRIFSLIEELIYLLDNI